MFALDKIADSTQLGRWTTKVFYPNEPARDQLRVGLLPPSAEQRYSGFGLLAVVFRVAHKQTISQLNKEVLCFGK